MMPATFWGGEGGREREGGREGGKEEERQVKHFHHDETIARVLHAFSNVFRSCSHGAWALVGWEALGSELHLNLFNFS